MRSVAALRVQTRAELAYTSADTTKDKTMINVSFPDGSKREYPDGSTPLSIAEAISKSLAKRSVIAKVDGQLHDMKRPLDGDVALELLDINAKESLELLRHDASHVMAQAVQELFLGTQVTIGPVVEDGFYYDFARKEPFSTDDFAKIEAKMKEIVDRDLPINREVWSKDDAIAHFKKIGEDYKAQIIDDIIPPGEAITLYAHGDQWSDLCRGPHLPSTGKLPKAFKLMKVAGAYWRGDHRNEMLQRIYGTAWANEKDLAAHLVRLEEAEKRDHRKVGRELDLFHMQEEGKGMVFWHDKGLTLWRTVESYVRRRLDAADYIEVRTPQVLDRKFWEQSGHWEKYRDNMFVAETAEDEVLSLKPMNCPGHVQIFKQGQKSYRDLPMRMAEFGACHRYEPSGALHGLMRVRGFTQDDAHIFCMEDQLASECMRINNLILTTYADFGFSGITVKLSTRPEKRVGSDENWDHAEAIMTKVLERIEAESGGTIKTMINPGEGAFYGPKFEYVLRDAIGRDWQCGTTQVDFNLPERFGAFYIDHESNKKQPVMVHRAICGSMERFLGILIENYAGHMPLWFAPLQVVVASITSEADDYCHEVRKLLKDAGMLAEVDVRNEKINYKVREHSLAKVPVMLVCGKREADDRTVNIRRLGSRDQTEMSLKDALAALIDEVTAPDIKRRKATLS